MVLGKYVYRSLRLLHGGAVVLWLHPRSALRKKGWFHSFHTGRAVDGHGDPIPWCTYSYIDFIEPRLHRSMRVFEYGAGNSTFFYAHRVGEVISVEHDDRWAAHLSLQLPAHCTLIHRHLGNEYVHEIVHHGKFDIVVIDGRLRTECASAALEALTPEGVLIWDNSDRSDYLAAAPLLLEQGFRHIDFSGLGPIVHESSRTTVLYRSENCLSI